MRSCSTDFGLAALLGNPKLIYNLEKILKLQWPKIQNGKMKIAYGAVNWFAVDMGREVVTDLMFVAL